MKFLGKNLLKHRTEQELTRDELAERSGVSKSMIKLLEGQSAANTTLDTAGKLAAALEVDPSELIELNGDQADPQEAST